MLGPFAAVPFVEAGGFRAALAAWALPYALVSLWAWPRVAARRRQRWRSAPSAVATSRAPGPEGEGEAVAYEADAGLAAVADGDEAGAPPTLGAGKKGGAGARGGGKRAAAADKVKLLVEESRVALDYEQGEIVE